MKKDLVSIVMPMYQSEAYLSMAIQGILDQTHTNWELWLIDDNSTDGTLKLARFFEKSDSRIKVRALSENLGPARARNLAIDLSQGRFIAFCDSDDLWMPEKLEKQIEVLNGNDAAVCFSSYYKMLRDNTFTDRLVLAEGPINYKELLKRNIIGCSTAVYDTAKCGKVFMPVVSGHEDYGLWLNILSKGYTGIGISKPLAYYRVHQGSFSSNKFTAAWFHWKVLRAVAELSWIRAIWFFLHYAYFGWRKQMN